MSLHEHLSACEGMKRTSPLAPTQFILTLLLKVTTGATLG